MLPAVYLWLKSGGVVNKVILGGLVLVLANLSFAQDLQVFKERREFLSQKMGEGIGLVFAGEEHEGSRFEVNPDFYYLTGLDDEPGAILILAPAEKRRKEMLLLKPRNPEEERWEGERLPLGGELRRKTGFKYIRRTDELPRWLNRFLNNCDTLGVLSRPAGYTSPVPEDLKILGELQSRWLGKTLKDCSRLITEMRLIKSQSELDLMTKAIRITEAGLKNVFANIRPGMSEEEVEIMFENYCQENGTKYLAFSSIVGSGHSSTVLHYTRNTAEIKEGDVVILDLGAEYEHYAADVTRTIPVSGKFSARQKEIYEIVWKAQQEALKRLKPGVTIDDIYDAAYDVIDKAGYGDNFMHGLTHFIGLEVHDVGFYDDPLKPGMVISVEPGIYIPEEDLGVRIEDDVLITKNGYRILSNGIPSYPDELEKTIEELKK
jgi:Xaa-Pro aminopeptidase